MEEAIVGHLKLTIVRTLYSQGFTKSSTHTVAVLTDLVDRYLKLLIASCADYAHHAGRASVNVYDTLLAMEEMGTTLDDMRDYCDAEAKNTQKYTVTLPKSAQELAGLKGISNNFHLSVRNRSLALRLYPHWPANRPAKRNPPQMAACTNSKSR